LLRFQLTMGWLCFKSGASGTVSSTNSSNGLKHLKGHVIPGTDKLKSRGHKPASDSVELSLGVPLRDPQGLSRFLRNVYDPASTEFHHFLSPEEFDARFGPSEADYQKVLQFASTHGFQITATHSNRMLVNVAATTANIEKAFHVQLMKFTHPTEPRDFYAPSAEPRVDASLPLLDIAGLTDYGIPHPSSHLVGPSSMPTAPGLTSATPSGGSSPGGGYYAGNDFRAAYLPGVTQTGAGQMVGMLEFDGYKVSNINTYNSKLGLTPVPLYNIYVTNTTGGTGSGELEVELDIEVAAAMAPGLDGIVVFEAQNNAAYFNSILSAMCSSNQIKQFSSSWSYGGYDNATTDQLFQKMAAQGQSFFQASGDSDAYTSTVPVPCDNPYITVVGGTTLQTSGPGGSWTGETVWNSGGGVGSSGGISPTFSIPVWQSGLDMTANQGSTIWRNLPDVALVADRVWCVYSNGITSGYVRGTSIAAPLWAAIAALANEQGSSNGLPPLGFINPSLYTLAQSSNSATFFHDITSGNNHKTSSPSLFNAVPGYDLCTGLGTVASTNLFTALLYPDSLSVSPVAGYSATGPVGGPFTPSAQVYSLSNNSLSTVSWSASCNASFISLDGTSGTLDAGQSITLTASPSTAALQLDTGTNAFVITIQNMTTGNTLSLPGSLTLSDNLLVNGGFETGDFTGWTLVGTPNSYSTVYNEVSTEANFDVVHSGIYGAFLGDQIVATLSQSVPTIPGQLYQLSLWLNNPIGGSPQYFAVKLNTNTSAPNTLYSITDPDAFGWTNLVFTQYASDTNMLLQFASQNAPNFFAVDDVVLSAVPTPSIRSISIIANSTVQISWDTLAGISYQVQTQTDANNLWVNLDSPIVANSSVTSYSTGISSNAVNLFRILRIP